MIHLDDLFTPDALAEALGTGLVTERHHDEFPLGILNYTVQAQYGRVWNEVTTQCRGLIFDTETAEIVARPWPKFYNFGEAEEAGVELPLDAPVQVFDKLDGSLGIMYQYGGRIGIATRGSFHSEQAEWATKFYRDWYSAYHPARGLTCLFEIIYPGNRIVVDYGGREALVALGIVHNETGAVQGPPLGWPGPRAEQIAAGSLQDALALESRENAEGVVVVFSGSFRDPQPNLMLKIKQDDYVHLHRLVTGLSPRTVWERLGAGETIADIQKGLPEEFAAWVQSTADGMLSRYGAMYEDANRRFLQMRVKLEEDYGGDFERKEFARRALSTDISDLLFQLLDGKDIKPAIWAKLKPRGEDARAEEGEE